MKWGFTPEGYSDKRGWWSLYINAEWCVYVGGKATSTGLDPVAKDHTGPWRSEFMRGDSISQCVVCPRSFKTLRAAKRAGVMMARREAEKLVRALEAVHDAG